MEQGNNEQSKRGYKCKAPSNTTVVKKEVDRLLEEEHIRWKQRVKQEWLQDGDCKTKL